MDQKNKIPKKFKLALNSVDSLEVLLQELYDEASRNIQEVQNEINKLANSTILKDEVMDAKVKYAKAMNDYSTNKNKAIGTKIDIAKIMMEVIKFHGNTKKMAEESNELPDDWGNFTETLDRVEANKAAEETQEVKVYRT